jgi:GNAT superfamily N-acetyltransferase
MRLADLRPGWATDFILHRDGALILERPDALVVRTPANPHFYWGNCLVLPQAPRDADVAHWLARFADEIGGPQPASRHVAIGVDAPREGREFPAWRAAGFEVTDTTMLRLMPGELQAPSAPPRGAVAFEVLDFAADGEAVIDVEMTDAQDFEPNAYRAYRRIQLQRFARLQAQGLAHWFGLVCDGHLAATCGLVRDRAGPGGTARFQFVVTHSDFRRRGLCSTLVHRVSAFAFDTWGAAEVYMGAVPTDVAIGIYRARGYRPVSDAFQFQRNAPEDRPA